MKVSYVTYRLSLARPFFQWQEARDEDVVHTGILLEHDDQCHEIHFRGNKPLIFCNHQEYNNNGRYNFDYIRGYEIGDIAIDDFQLILSECKDIWDHRAYRLGDTDCWAFVIWFCDNFSLDLSNVEGPLEANPQELRLGQRVRENVQIANDAVDMCITALYEAGDMGIPFVTSYAFLLDTRFFTRTDTFDLTPRGGELIRDTIGEDRGRRHQENLGDRCSVM